MSPLPEILKPEILQGLDGPDMVETAVRVQRLIETPKYIKDHPQDAIIDKTLPLKLSAGILFRGTSFIEFSNKAIHEGLIPYNPQNPRSPIFLHKGFGIDTSFNMRTQILTVTRAGKSDLSVRFTQHELPSPYHWTILEAMVGLAVIPDGFWKDIQEQGLVIGNLLGDYYDKKWYIQTNMDGILLPDSYDTSSNPALTPMGTDLIARIIHDRIATKVISSPRAERLMAYQPVAILADLRTGK